MKASFSKTLGLLFVAALFFTASTLPVQDTKAGIKERMKGRYAKILEQKKTGVLGETPAGFLEAVKPADAEAVASLVTAENEDRKSLYALLGQESDTPAEEVGMANAKRIFQKAADTDYFKLEDDTWKMKKEMIVPE